MSPAAAAVDGVIRTYQRQLSPRKGWRCAHAVVHGGSSCSTAVRELLAARGLVRAVAPTVVRFVACHGAARALPLTEVSGVCCCGPIPIPFRFGSSRHR